MHAKESWFDPVGNDEGLKISKRQSIIVRKTTMS